ncbi:MAG: outer membrane protein assembly factor BamD [Proteobacteria bacterium]|nr:outer membrane protein assembly factor BamD [Pseudomonadota bacterium]MBU1647737.1 outer membrane protein assembly factor BamD [Pseudomonadota bacterium]MBU1986488.1 outer membrane protein assembly factor BamD [Pseudomonadota bacterium]
MQSPASFSRSLIITLLSATLLTLSLSGCATMKSWFGIGGEEIQIPADSLAIKGMDAYDVGDYYEAAKHFNEILDNYPFSPQAMLAELKGADCNYFMENYAEALVLYKRFEEQHPTNEAIPYVLYQIAMCSYQQIDTIDRDTSGATKAIRDFTRLIKAFPESPYTDEAKARSRAAKEFLVNHEYLVVEFYLRTDKYLDAKTRLKYLVSTYPDASITPKAKELLAKIETGEKLGFNLSSWFSGLVELPDWHLFSSEKPTEQPLPSK